MPGAASSRQMHACTPSTSSTLHWPFITRPSPALTGLRQTHIYIALRCEARGCLAPRARLSAPIGQQLQHRLLALLHPATHPATIPWPTARLEHQHFQQSGHNFKPTRCTNNMQIKLSARLLLHCTTTACRLPLFVAQYSWQQGITEAHPPNSRTFGSEGAALLLSLALAAGASLSQLFPLQGKSGK